jgi:ATP/maltotriose-dependent transcriptional regulator MalT
VRSANCHKAGLPRFYYHRAFRPAPNQARTTRPSECRGRGASRPCREQTDASLVVAQAKAPADADTGLTSRELEVLELLAEGASNKTIAHRLGMMTYDFFPTIE